MLRRYSRRNQAEATWYFPERYPGPSLDKQPVDITKQAEPGISGAPVMVAAQNEHSLHVFGSGLRSVPITLIDCAFLKNRSTSSKPKMNSRMNRDGERMENTRAGIAVTQGLTPGNDRWRYSAGQPGA